MNPECSGRFVELPDAPGYGVSEDGFVWTRKIPGHRGKLGSTWRKLKGRPDKDGYLQVQFSIDGIAANRKVHTVVLLAFVGPPQIDDYQCRHLDGNKTNNALINVQWGTRLENQEDKVRHGTINSGSRHGLAKLCESDVLEIRSLYAAGGIFQKDIAAKFGVCRELVGQIVRRDIWTHI